MARLKVAAGLLAGSCMCVAGQATAQAPAGSTGVAQAPPVSTDSTQPTRPSTGINQAPEPPVGGADAAAGQDARATAATPQGATDGDIIVTAQRRDESLSRTPVAVAVLSADALAKAQVVSERDLATATPGLSVRASFNTNQLNFALRGQSQDVFSGTRPGVLPYVNEVQIGGGGSTAFYDLQSIQVLKGPQGTLFGRSATGGAVLFTTVKPTDTLGGYASLTGGNFGEFKAEGAINLPLVGDTLMARVAGFHQTRHGYQRNLYFGNRVGDLDRSGARGSLTAKSGIFRNDLVIDYLHTQGGSTTPVISGLLPFTGTGGPPFIPLQLLYAGTTTPVARATGIGTISAFLPPAFAPLVPGFYDNYFANPKHPAGGLNAVLAAQQARGPYVVDQDGVNAFRGENVVVTNATTVDVGENTQIKNIFGFTHLESVLVQDADATPFAISQNSNVGQNESLRATTRQVSEELQLLGTTLGDRLSYVTGLYFQDERTTTHQHSNFFDILLGGQEQLNSFKITAKTYAGYAQGTYKLNDSGLAVTVGLRYTSEKSGKIIRPDDSIRLALGTPAPAGFSYDKSQTYKRLSWQLGLQDQVNSDLLLYAVSRRAYKSGGFNGVVAPKNGPASQAGDAFAAERVTDVELGSKFKGELGSLPVRANIAVYHNWLRNSQRVAFSVVNANPASLTVNVPSGKVYGAEVDGQIQVAPWLTLGGVYNYTHARFGSDPVSVNGAVQIFNQVTDTPRHSGSVFADITIPVSDTLSVLLHGDATGQTKTFTAPQAQNNVGTVLPGYVLGNFRVGLSDSEAGWSLTANLKNAFDRTYYVGGLPVGQIYQINTRIPGVPRTVTVEARIRF